MHRTHHWIILLVASSIAGASLPATTARATPSVTAIAPAAGNLGGGTPVTVTGAGFLPGATLKLGNVSCTQVKVVGGSRIIGVTGAHAAGTASVTVFNSATDSSAANALFTYNSTTDLTKTSKSEFEVAGSTHTNLNTVGLDSTLRWTDWTPTTGGSIAAGTYYYVVTASNAAGETRRSVQSAGTTLAGATNAVQLNWTSIPGALQYKLYRTAVSGTYASPALIATLDTTGYKDTAVSPSAGAPLGFNTATGDVFLACGTTPAFTFSAGPALTGNAARDAFSIQRPDGNFLIVHANNSATTSIYDPNTNGISAGPNLTANAEEGAHGFKRPDGKFLIVHGNVLTSTSIYDPVANTMAAGPATSAAVDKGGLALKRPDGKFLIVHGNSVTSTSIYDPVGNTMSAGPAMTGSAGIGAHAFRRPDGKFLIVRGSDATGTTLYDPVASTMSAGPATTAAVGSGGQVIERPDGRFLIVHGSNAKATTLYDPVANTMVAGPVTANNVNHGSFSIQRADGTFLVFNGNGTTRSFIYDPVAGTLAAGPSLSVVLGNGGHALERPDGQYLIINGNNGTSTTLYDAGWYRTGTYVSEKLHPSDINWWNTISWVQEADDTVTMRVRTATSSAGLDAAPWRTVTNGAGLGAGAGETWLEIEARYARAIPKLSLALEDVWGRWRAEFRRWPVPDLLSLTANYTPTTLSISPSRTTFLLGGQPTNTWVAADSSVLQNDGSVSETVLGKISTFTSGPYTWLLSASANGADQIRAQWSTATATGPWNDVAAYDQEFTIATGLAAGGSVKLYFRIQTPTSTNPGISYASTLTVTAQ